jgi:hypothetical protein
MNHPKNLGEALIFLLEKVESQFLSHQQTQRERVFNELKTGWYRFVLPGCGWQRASYTAKLTTDEKREADAFAATLPIKVLPQLLVALEKGFVLAKASKASQATYGARLRSALESIQSEPWYPGNAVLNRRSLDEIRPLMRHGRGDWRAFSLMQHKGKPLKYRLEKHEISAVLQQYIDKFYQFMTAPNHFERCFDEVEKTTADTYLSGILLLLGWVLHEDQPTLNPEALSLEHLVPLITEEMLEELSEKQKKKFWRREQAVLEERINRYFDFLLVKQKADSPRTRLLKLATLLMLAKFLYASQVEEKEDYKNIPIIRTILKRIDQEQSDVQEWEKNRHYVADQSRKWPEPPEGQTVLEYVQSALIETLRLECRPRQSTGDFCKGRIIAKSHLIYLMFVDLGLLPPGRQQEPRTFRIALSCPVARPETVPAEGVYWPLPPDWAREKDQKGRVNDNYLYFTYHHEGQTYEQGIWVVEMRDYKTDKCHGVRIDIMPNLRFDDGHRLYDYFDRYLCGQWYVGNFDQGHRYTWWDTQLRGSYGKWLSQGRAEFCTEATPVFRQSGKSEEWVVSYLFITPTTGRQFSDCQMSDYFARNSFRIIGKRITPHTFRYMWATFSGQAGLTDAERRSLATAMGCTPETLRQMYERMSPTEKNRPINEAMQKLLPLHVEHSKSNNHDPLIGINEKLSRMDAEELQKLRQFLGIEPAG